MTDPLIERRARLLGPNVPTFYDEPVHIVRGEGVWLWDAAGRRYLDAYNNVPHVGHCHPKVVEAIAAQAARLNTHTRYLHETILDYVERLTATLGHDLRQAVMVCTGSEANDVALRMAQAATGKTGLIATDNTYHGNTAAVSALSTRRPPIGGYPPHVRLVPAPDSLAPLGGSAEAQPEAFAANVARAIAELEEAG
ncbi:aminotransferase class III-fold pyridoxal phosphate-dependent enzyme, partial [Rhodovulum sulfidophilum]